MPLSMEYSKMLRSLQAFLPEFSREQAIGQLKFVPELIEVVEQKIEEIERLERYIERLRGIVVSGANFDEGQVFIDVRTGVRVAPGHTTIGDLIDEGMIVNGEVTQ